MQPPHKKRPVYTLLFAALLIGGTLGAAVMALVLTRNGARFHSLNSIVAFVSFCGISTAFTTFACSRNGNNAPGKTALWAAILTIGSCVTSFFYGKNLSASDFSYIAIGEGTGALMLTVCSYLAVLWYRLPASQQTPH